MNGRSSGPPCSLPCGREMYFQHVSAGSPEIYLPRFMSGSWAVAAGRRVARLTPAFAPQRGGRGILCHVAKARWAR